MNYRVFTYGTLMKGRSNHHYVKDEQYLYDGVLYGYGLKETPYAYPAAIPMEGFKVYGEIYEVDEKTKKMSAFSMTARKWKWRRKTEVRRCCFTNTSRILLS